MASDTYHEALELLSETTKNLHRAVVTLIEELEAIDWYQQRADACSDPHLKEILVHNKNEEIEHATMVLEWLRRNSTAFDAMMRKYLFSAVPVTEIEDREKAPAAGGPAPPTLGLGSLKER
jgi:ferritin-like protein